jgi:hypothetical protein
MSKEIENNKAIFLINKIPFKENANKDSIFISTIKVEYEISLKKVGNNPYVFKVIDLTSKKVDVICKEVFTRRMCNYFKTDFIHWNAKKANTMNQYIKVRPKEIVEGQLYTTTWANPVAQWVLKEYINDDNIILSSPKTNKEILTKSSELMVWINTNEK